MTLQQLTMDGVVYHVRVVYDSMELSFELIEGPNAGTMLSGRDERDLLGTEYGYQLAVEPDPAYREDYDAFFHAISAPVNTHHIELPYGQTTLAYDAKVTGGRLKLGGKMMGKNLWHGLVVNYEPIEPQRVPDDDEADW